MQHSDAWRRIAMHPIRIVRVMRAPIHHNITAKGAKGVIEDG